MLQTRHMKSQFWINRTYLRLIAAAVLACCVAIFVGIALFVTQRLHSSGAAPAQAGYLDLSSCDLERAPIYLSGEWTLLSPDSEFSAEGVPIVFPIGSITEATQDAVYRLRFTLPPNAEEMPLYLCIPTFRGPLEVYLNGVRLSLETQGDRWVSFRAMETLYPLSAFITSDGGEQELILSENFSDQSLTLYKRPVLIGTVENLSTLVLFDGSNEMFLIGILLLILINGFVFMLFRPTHSIISMMTLFDTTIMLRVAFSMNHMLTFAESILPNLSISDTSAAALKLFVLMLGGTMGCLLSSALFDPEKKAPRWLIVPTPYVYVLFSILFPLNMVFFEQYGRFLLFGLYGYTFLGVGVQFFICWRDKPRQTRVYYGMQGFKTAYIGILVFIDILLWTEYFDFMLLFYLYSIFFIMHVLVRLYDNNQSYRSVEILNQSLESTVAERTAELSQANQILSELSIRDPLTKVFNRLYFESALEAAYAQYVADGTSVHLCMFDLDFFKSVNDTYGHSEGDEQLRRIAAIVSAEIEDDVVFARVGGEEFILLFQGRSAEQLMVCIQAIHTAIQADVKANPSHTTASFGIAELAPGETTKHLLKNVDLALYDAKNAGRNQIIQYISAEHTETGL